MRGGHGGGRGGRGGRGGSRGEPAPTGPSAFLVIDKPAGITSHDVVAAVRALTGCQKVGHTGTLDPFATGVLPLALEGATRLIQFLDESLKVYDATISLGTRMDTGDPTGAAVESKPVLPFTEARLREVLLSFVGPRMQVPPAYSAVKKDGKALYQYAREGETVEVAARPITISAMELISFTADTVRVRIDCSRGTYARVLAEEIAVELGTVGHLGALARLRSGPFSLDDAVDFPTLAALASAEEGRSWQEVLIARSRKGERVPWRGRPEVLALLQPWMRTPINCLSHLPLADVGPDGAKKVRSGGPPPSFPAGVGVGGKFLVVDGDSVVAVAERGAEGLKISRVF